MPKRPFGTSREGSSNEDFEDTLDRYYDDGYEDGYTNAILRQRRSTRMQANAPGVDRATRKKPKRKLSAWQKFVKEKGKLPRFKYKSGKNKGKVNMRALGVAWRKTPAGKKSSRR